MRAAVFQGPGKILMTNVADPVPGEGEVLLRVQYCGICGTDLHEYGSGRLFYGPQRPTGTILGHEFSAVVLEAGPGVAGVWPGDLVAVNPAENCRECSFCLGGDEHLCQNASGIGYGRPGGLAEYTVAAARRCVRFPQGFAADAAALTEPLAVAMHAVSRAAAQPPDTAFVAGAGPIGQLTLIALLHAGVSQVVVSEPSPARRQRAKDLGAAVVIDPLREDPGPLLRHITGERGADLSIECVGAPGALDDCLAATRRGGRIVVAGVFQERHPVDFARLLMAEHQLIGAFAYRVEFPHAANLISRREIDVLPVVSHRIPLDAVATTFAAIVHDRDAFEKVLVEMPGVAGRPAGRDEETST